MRPAGPEEHINRLPAPNPQALSTARGETVIAPDVVATVARLAAREVDGVEVVDSSGLRGILGGSDGATADVATRQAAIDLRLAVCWPRPIASIVDDVRRYVTGRVQYLTGYVVT